MKRSRRPLPPPVGLPALIALPAATIAPAWFALPAASIALCCALVFAILGGVYWTSSNSTKKVDKTKKAV